MSSQTISLFRFMMLGILSRRFFALILVLLFIAVLAGGFIHELSIINSEAIATAFVADFLRYSMALLLLLVIAASVAEDYEFRQFERMLTMPLARWQYIAAQVLVVVCLCLLLAVPVAALIFLYGNLATAVYWGIALWLEFFLLGVLGLLAILSLEKIPQAVFFALAVYLLAKLSGLIGLMLSESIKLTEASALSRAVDFIFSAILYVIPGPQTFAENDVFFNYHDLIATLGEQLASVSVYALFLLAVCLVDFYRKEFNL